MESEITNTEIPKRRKSVRLTKEELKALKEFTKPFNTGVEAAEALGIDRAVMLRVILVGSGAPETIEKIRSVINGSGEKKEL